MKLHNTKGLVLRSVKYGETSLIVTVFTELFGIQSYIVNGVRVSARKGAGKASSFQPSALLDLVVYNNELRNLQRIKEFRWSYLYVHILSDVLRNSIALFMVELLTKCLKQPESNPDLFAFCEDSLIHLDKASDTVAANFPLFFALHVTAFFGIPPPTLKGSLNEVTDLYFDLKEGEFTEHRPDHPYCIDGKFARVTADLINIRQPEELEQLKLNQEFRRTLLQAYELYFALHIQDFGTMKTLPVLKEILG